VKGATTINGGSGQGTNAIRDSVFAGFTYLAGAGNDDLHVDHLTYAGTSKGTRFDGAVLIDMGAGNDIVTLGTSGSPTDNRVLFSGASTSTKGGLGTDTLVQANVFHTVSVPSLLGFENVSQAVRSGGASDGPGWRDHTPATYNLLHRFDRTTRPIDMELVDALFANPDGVDVKIPTTYEAIRRSRAWPDVPGSGRVIPYTPKGFCRIAQGCPDFPEGVTAFGDGSNACTASRVASV
jgi:hypothetical protein